MQQVDPQAVIAHLTQKLAQLELEVAIQAVAIQDLREQLAKKEETAE